MTIFEPDFILSYPCFVSDIFDPRFLGYKKLQNSMYCSQNEYKKGV